MRPKGGREWEYFEREIYWEKALGIWRQKALQKLAQIWAHFCAHIFLGRIFGRVRLLARGDVAMGDETGPMVAIGCSGANW